MFKQPLKIYFSCNIHIAQQRCRANQKSKNATFENDFFNIKIFWLKVNYEVHSLKFFKELKIIKKIMSYFSLHAIIGQYYRQLP